MLNLEFKIPNLPDGSKGTMYTCSYEWKGERYYLKLSNYDSDKGCFKGHESLNEIIVSRFLDVIKIPHLKYEPVLEKVLVEGRLIETILCRSKDFVPPGMERRSFYRYYKEDSDGIEPFSEFFIKRGFEDYLYNMILVDYLIMNRDRLHNNIEVLFDLKKGGINMAPLFDHGTALLWDCKNDDEIKNFDVKKDRRCLTLFGSLSVTKNLKLIPKDHRKKIKPLSDKDIFYIFDGLEGYMSKIHKEKITEMLNVRIGKWNMDF